MRRVAHLSSHHADDDIRVFRKEAVTLARGGYEVSYVVPTVAERTEQGVRVVGVTPPSSRLVRLTVTPWRVFGRALRLDAEVYHFHDPELMLPGVVLKLLGKRVVYDVHEDLPRQVLSKAWIPAWVRRPLSVALEILEQAVARVVDGVIAATPHIARRFPASKTHVVQNFPILGELATAGALPQDQRPAQLIYVGGITDIRGARESVRAIGLLNERRSARLVLVGNVASEELAAELKALPGWEHVDHKGWLSREEVAAELARSRAGLVLFHPVPNHGNAQPNKLFEYMSAGLPVVASDFPAWRELLVAADCGLLVDPFDVEAIAMAMQAILDDPAAAQRMGENGSRAVRCTFNWDAEATRLLEAYERLVPLGG